IKNKAMQEGWSQGLSQGINEGLSQGISQGLSQGLNLGIAQGLSKGRCTLLIELICQKLSLQKTISEITNDLSISRAEIEPIYNIAKDFAPDYPVEQIYEKLMEAKS
ncbi:MAG: hypothetical protein ACI39W_08265, partial [Brotaphodocola sp.]